MLKWIALALESNNEHGKMSPNLEIAAPRGFMLNLVAVMLRICDPFLEPSSGKAWGKLDSRQALLYPLVAPNSEGSTFLPIACLLPATQTLHI